MPKQFEDFIYPACVLLKSSGYDFLDRPRSKWITLLMRLYLLATLICFTVVTFYATLIAVNELREGLPNVEYFYRLITDIDYNIIAYLKCIFFVKHLRRNQKICKIFSEIFPKDREERKLYRIQEYFWPKWIRGFLFFYLFSVALIILGPMVEMPIDYLIQYFKVGYAEAKFGYVKAYDIQYAFDHHNPVGYVLLYLLEILNAHFGVTFTMCPDLFILAYAMLLCIHFDHISRELESYDPSSNDTSKDCHFLSGLVQKHELVLNLSRSLREAFSALILIMFFSTAVIICSTGVYVLSQGLTGGAIGFFSFLVSALGQYFLICYSGQQIINKSTQVCEAAYNNCWYNGSPSYRKSILIILTRSQREAEINAGGFQTTNLAAFQEVTGFTYRVFTVLKTMFF